MRSPAESVARTAPARGLFETALRVAALALLAVALWLELRPDPASRVEARRASADELAGALARWTDDPAATHVHVEFAGVPADTVRDWLRALGAAGADVAWSARGLTPVAVAAEAVADPMQPVRLLAAAPAGTEVAFSDSAGPFGAAEAAGAGAGLVAGAVAGAARAAVDGSAAAAAPPAPRVLRPVLVLGSAGWEGKFVAAALEERGWEVTARFLVGPGVQVGQGTVGTIDTASYAAVVALDSAAASYAGAIGRYVRSGGGLVLARQAAALPALRPLAAAQAAAPSPGDAGRLAAADPRLGLPLAALAVRDDAVPVESRGAQVAVAARRVGAGRVVQVGYDETWRWRMAGPDGAPDAHRRWWSGLVSAAAYAPVAAAEGDGNRLARLDDAPAARLIAALGPPSDAADDGGAGADDRERGAPPWMLPLVAALLLAEWASRRTRGLR